ncbi:MAG TPA: hypothetical protein VN282_06160 [Pyrinomonadaceae bacterium]|nr:hypothetical protein [Pyrinomonadaceae bacterium]
MANLTYTTTAVSGSVHDREVATLAGASAYARTDTRFTFTFYNFFHPHVGELMGSLYKGSLADMLDARWHETLRRDFFRDRYGPTEGDELTRVVYFPKEIDVSPHGPYANYNWELLFHVPLTVAVHLSKTRRFAEAQRWFHFIFDPTANDETVPTPERFWKFLAFRRAAPPLQIDELLMLLSKPEGELSPEEKTLRDSLHEGYREILRKPFQPHAVARTRHVAYQYGVVMKYLDNLIAWGDDLFQQDTVESINEATQRYVLAANLLGPRPQRIPPRGAVRPMTFADIAARDHDPLGNALVELEGQFPFNLAHAPGSGGGVAPASAGPLFGIGRALYFCIPRNDKLLGYWDAVADRLFKIRHCMNLAGVVRPLALFDPPLDPGMLVKAAAAGIDVGSAVGGLNQPTGPVRGLALIQKALELCAEVRGLGSALLAALEKRDAERLSLTRQAHEVRVQQMAREVRYMQWRAAQEATTSLLTARGSALERLRFYARLLGLPADPNAPDELSLERPTLTEETFDEVYSGLVGRYDKALTLQDLPDMKIAGGASPAQQSGVSGAGRLYLNTNEDADLNRHAPESRRLRLAAGVNDGLYQTLAMLPDFGIKVQWWGIGGDFKFGGTTLGTVGRIISGSLNTAAGLEDSYGGSASKTGSFERRADDWVLQYNLAARELMQNGRQILGSLIAEQAARQELDNVRRQIENAQEVERFLHEKFTNEELLAWMQGETSRLFYEYYRLAFDTARKAERTMKRELMRPELDAQDFVKFNYWDGGRKGLLSGEALHLDVKRMELAYHENNRRELELTRHVSLRQLDPVALLSMRATGTCQVEIPEWLYDRDCPGHYMRRIKSVALSLPSVVGPYASVNCTLSLLRSSLRKSADAGANYARREPEDPRFVDYVGAVQSVVTSSAGNDSGLFEANLRDERFLPFEGEGAVSTWKLELPRTHRAFDYSTISDVILHVRYTARQGVNPAAVRDALDEAFAEAGSARLALLFSLRHDFPTEWAAFAGGGAPFTASIRKDYFPYFAEGKTIRVEALELYAADASKHHELGAPDPAAKQAARDAAEEGLAGPDRAFTLSAPEDPAGPTRVLTRQAGQVFLVIRYSVS